MKQLSFLFVVVMALPGLQAHAQSKKDARTAAAIRKDITYLASDELHGRRIGTTGEIAASNYIETRYREEKIGPFKGQYKHSFQFVHGKEITTASAISIDGSNLQLNEDFFPLPFTKNGSVTGECLPSVMETGLPWVINLYADKTEADDPDFDWEKVMHRRSKEAAEQGAAAILFYDGFGARSKPYFNASANYETVNIPVAFITYPAYKKYITDTDSTDRSIKVDANTTVNIAEHTGINVAAFIDNKVRYTVVIGAHYDHLGMGEDDNSLYTGKDKQVHPGADDNASGTAALLEIARWIKTGKLHHYNYLLVNFSGEELGLLGSKAFIKDGFADSANVAYMINMDMIGRLNDSTHALYVGGLGTSPAWANVLDEPEHFKYVIDSSGIGPSDHSSFYHAGIPVLSFFTGSHKDYHKPTDVADKINYNGEVQVLKQIYSIVKIMEKKPKPVFTANEVQ